LKKKIKKKKLITQQRLKFGHGTAALLVYETTLLMISLVGKEHVSKNNTAVG